jgi:hypothetical protein
MASGYSGTPLAKKLSLKAGLRVWFDGMPDSVRAEIAPEALGLVMLDAPEPNMDAAHIFTTRRAVMTERVAMLRTMIAKDEFVWISWPKKASKVPTDITEDLIRADVLPTGFVDVKVCAVDAIWSGLKLMIRKELR